jgi:hypothetical protein
MNPDQVENKVDWLLLRIEERRSGFELQVWPAKGLIKKQSKAIAKLRVRRKRLNPKEALRQALLEWAEKIGQEQTSENTTKEKQTP